MADEGRTTGRSGSSKLNVSGDRTVIKSLALGGLLGGGGECFVDVKDGKVLGVRSFRYDWKYDREKLNAWKIERNGKTLEPRFQSLPSPFSLAYKKAHLFSCSNQVSSHTG